MCHCHSDADNVKKRLTDMTEALVKCHSGILLMSHTATCLVKPSHTTLLLKSLRVVKFIE